MFQKQVTFIDRLILIDSGMKEEGKLLKGSTNSTTRTLKSDVKPDLP